MPLDTLNSYYVITLLMSRVFEGKIRRLGNSMAVIVPKEVLEETGAREGDTMKLSIAVPTLRRNKLLKDLAGVSRHSKPFAREKGDRI